jgi:hypothetical protein
MPENVVLRYLAWPARSMKERTWLLSRWISSGLRTLGAPEGAEREEGREVPKEGGAGKSPSSSELRLRDRWPRAPPTRVVAWRDDSGGGMQPL